MISVCLATYNGEKYIIPQIKSILSQLSAEDELLISDDGSTDNTLKLINELNDRRIKVLSNSTIITNRSFDIISKVSNNFFNAIFQAKGDTIYLSDQDDIWITDKITLCEEQLKKNDLVIHRRKDVNSKLIALNNATIPDDSRKIDLFSALSRPPFQGSCMGFTKRVKKLLIQNKFIISEFPLSHDHIIGFITWMYLGKKNICFIKDPLILYRRHGNNVSSTSEKSKNSLHFKLKYRFLVLKLLCILYFRNLIIE